MAKEIYIYGGIVENYIYDLLILGTFVYTFVVLNLLFKNSKRFLIKWALFAGILMISDIYKMFIVLKNANNALKYNKNVLVSCGKIQQYRLIGTNREEFKINNIEFDIKKSTIKDNYSSFEFAKKKKFTAQYINVLGSNILIRLYEVPGCENQTF